MMTITCSALPNLTIAGFADDGYKRSLINRTEFKDYNTFGSAVIGGRAYERRYSWQIGTILKPSDLELLQAIAAWQDREHAEFRAGTVTLADEVQLLDPEPSPHSKTLVAAIPTSFGFVSGYGVFSVKLQIALEQPEWVGTSTKDGQPGYLIQFQAIEVSA